MLEEIQFFFSNSQSLHGSFKSRRRRNIIWGTILDVTITNYFRSYLKVPTYLFTFSCWLIPDKISVVSNPITCKIDTCESWIDTATLVLPTLSVDIEFSYLSIYLFLVHTPKHNKCTMGGASTGVPGVPGTVSPPW